MYLDRIHGCLVAHLNRGSFLSFSLWSGSVSSRRGCTAALILLSLLEAIGWDVEADSGRVWKTRPTLPSPLSLIGLRLPPLDLSRSSPHRFPTVYPLNLFPVSLEILITSCIRARKHRGTREDSPCGFLRILSPQANWHVPAAMVDGYFRLFGRASAVLSRPPRETAERVNASRVIKRDSIKKIEYICIDIYVYVIQN